MWTETQQSIIYREPDHGVVYAAPGSGKTAVLTAHCCELFRKSAVNPSGTMVLTFTRQAAVELKKRLLAANGISRTVAESVQAGTFHAQIFRALLANQPDIPVLLGQVEQRRMLMSALAMEGMNLPRELPLFANALTRSKCVWPHAPVKRRYRRAARRYETMKAKSHRWDFDDILSAFCVIWEKQTDFSSLFQRTDYVLVDEFQDTNQIQWTIIVLIASMGAKVFVVGDDDQSIYGFRGASPEWLLAFTHHFSSSRAFHLATNFRSDQTIVQHSAMLIRHNQQRMDKPFACRSAHEGICQVRFPPDEWAEATMVRESIQQALRANPLTSIAVLARTRQQLYHVWRHLRLANLANVQCRTYHDAKGKEWDVVHIVGAISSNPYLARPVEAEEVEEERRLFYVAMTRARHSLYIHAPRRAKGLTLPPVQFIEECGF